MVQPASGRFIPVEMLTSSHYMFGQVKVGNNGMLGLLSDPHNSYMEISEASLARVQTPDNVINYATLMWAVKQQVVAVALGKREYVGPMLMVRGGYAQILQYPIQITTTVYEIRGTLQWSGRLDFSALMAEGTNAFIVLFDAVLISTLFPKLRIERPALLFNRSYLDTFMHIKKTEG